MGKTIRGARKGKNSIFTAHTRLRKGPVRLRKIDYAEKCAGRVPLSRLFDRPIGATAARQIPVLKVTCSNHVSVTPATRARRLTRTSPAAVPLLPLEMP